MLTALIAQVCSSTPHMTLLPAGVLLEHKGLKRVGTVLGKSLFVGILVVQTHLQSKGRGERAATHRYGR